ncbi:MAG: YidC/Oxa1 family membrane protein insertase [Candidatus Paceibacterota bacterium]
MFSTIWHALFFDPVYNGLVFFIDIIPGGDVGLAIIAITIVVKLILLPLSIKATKTQKVIKEIEPQLRKIQEENKSDREALAKATMALYKEAGINPFSSILLLFVQLPFIIALYLAVLSGGGVPLPDINEDLLYFFVGVPPAVDMIFMGLVDIAAKSWPLALLAGLTQFVHAKMSLPKLEPKKPGEVSMKADFARSMDLNMRYVLPAVIAVVAYTLSASIALYFVVSNLVAIAQELVVRKHR